MAEGLTTQQVADLIGVDRKTVCRWAAQGSVPCVRDERGWRRFRPEDVRGLVTVTEATVTPLTQLDRMVSRPAQRALQREHRGEWDFTCPFVVILRPSENGTAMWEPAAEGQDPVIVLCPNCQHFGFMDYGGAWRCRRYCKTNTNKFWNEPGGGIWWPGELPFIRAPRSGR